MTRRVLFVLLPILAVGCDLLGPDDDTCDPFPPSPALFVTVFDSLSGEIIEASQVEVTVTDGAFSETRGGGDRDGPAQFSMALERPGIYRVDAVASGYLDWTLRDIRVESNRCGIESRGVNVRLQGQGPL